MSKRTLVYISLFTVLVCCLFVNYNPNIASDLSVNFTDGDIVSSQGDHFDFKAFSLNCTKSERFTTKIISQGHTQFVDNESNITINLIQLDRMIRSSRDWHSYLLKNELEHPAWTVDGISIHEIDFIFHDPLYSAYEKDSSKNSIVYLSTPDERETARMMNSLRFN